MATKQEYNIGDVVYVKATDYSKLLKGIIVSFQAVDCFLPIVECDHPFRKGEKFKSAFSLTHISKTPVIEIAEWKLVVTTYEYKE